MITQADLLPMLVEAAGIQGPSPRAGGEEVLLEYYAKQKHVNPIRTIRTRRWKLNAYDSGGRELYDLQRDPHERANLAGETRHASVQSHLQAKIDKWRAPLGA